MRVVFLADAHLKGPGEPEQAKLTRFLAALRGRKGEASDVAGGGPVIDRLVIAGDFFDFWFARGTRVYPGFRPILDRLAALKRQGVRITICEGNHDFSLKAYFTDHMGIEVHTEAVTMTIDGRRILVAHGDTVDRSNRRYLALRRFLRSAFARGLQRLLPLRLLWGIARVSSRVSKGMTDASHDRLAEIMHRFARDKFQEGYDVVILGHCHRAALVEERLAGRETLFATLGDWSTHDTYLLGDEGRFTLSRIATPPA